MQALHPNLSWTAESTIATWPALKHERAVTEELFMGRFEALLTPQTGEAQFDVLIGRLNKLSKASIMPLCLQILHHMSPRF